MDNDRWLELEYQALRDEILALGAAERDAVKFYVPIAALAYAVPYYLLEQADLRPPALAHQTFLWTFAASVTGLLLLAMLRSILWSVDGSRRLGMYIKTVIEPRTRGGLRYEWLLFQLQQERPKRPSDVFMISLGSVLVNCLAAGATGRLFIKEAPEAFFPVSVALGFAIASIGSILTIRDSRGTRRRYHEHMKKHLKDYYDNSKPRG
ncbi:MAG: hypothetical protein QOJ98_370 [Acidobacteriota bacterium]|jgi:hypothetical protein|nr:hypothetical protein [Acidobacteriota bacterium]